jgi:hypothetical protein
MKVIHITDEQVKQFYDEYIKELYMEEFEELNSTQRVALLLVYVEHLEDTSDKQFNDLPISLN